MIALTYEGDTPEMRFTIPIMDSTKAFEIPFKHLGINSCKELRHPISWLHCGDNPKHVPTSIVNLVLKDYPLLNIAQYC